MNYVGLLNSEEVVPTPTDTGTGGTVTTPTMSYEEYLNSQKQTAIDNAAAARNRQINAAQVGYDQARATYGSQAAALSGMGLQGSGYSQYLDSQAYAQKNAAIANAYRTEADTVKAAENSYNNAYQNYLQTQEQNRGSVVSGILKDIGNYSLDDISYLSNLYGLTQGDTDYLRKGYASHVLSTDDYTINDIDGLRDIIGEEAYAKYYNDVVNADYDTSANAFVRTDEDGNTAMGDRAYADSIIEMFEKRGVKKETIDALKTSRDEYYNARTIDGLEVVSGAGTKLSSGGVLEVRDSKDHYYNVKVGGEADQEVTNSAMSLNNGTVFARSGKLYIKHGGKVYSLEERTIVAPGDYQKLEKLFHTTK